MIRFRYLIVMLGAVFGVVVQVVPASAATAGWMVNGATFTGTAALATTAAVDRPFELKASEVEVQCANTLYYENPTINGATESASFAAAEFTGCRGTQVCPLGAKQGTTVKTLPISIALTLQGASVIKGVFLPKNTSKLFATIEFGGSECSFAGVSGISGSEGFLTLTGHSEGARQLLEAYTLQSGELKLASSAAVLSGAVLLKLASGLPFSFL